MTTRWPRTAPPPRPPLPLGEVRDWIARQREPNWRDEFSAWCAEHGTDPVEAIRAAADAKLSEVRGDG